jgi:hypothetical protein
MTKESLSMTQHPQLEPTTEADRAPVRKLAVVFLAVSALLGVLSAGAAYAFLHEYGTTTGSWVDGAVDGLGFAAVGLVIVAAVAGVGLLVGRRTNWVRVGAVAVVALSLAGVMVAGGQAALGKYGWLDKVPNCGTAAEGNMAGARAGEAEFARMAHPEPFGGGWYGVDGCGATLLNASFVEAAAHYRVALPEAGWTITRDDSSQLAARRNDLIFSLMERCNALEIEIRLAGTTNVNRC